MNKAELIDAMANGANISPEKAGVIYGSLVEELTSTAQAGGVDFQPFGISHKNLAMPISTVMSRYSSRRKLIRS